MNEIDRLVNNYQKQTALPWTQNLAGKQRVWFAVYDPSSERYLRARIQHFEMATRESKHGWLLLDLTRLLPQWLAKHEYREQIFSEPRYFTPGEQVENLAIAEIKKICTLDEADSNAVVAIMGLASLFGFVRVSRLLDTVEADIRGRLLVFFPGEYQQNMFRFMNARDGFNYMAVPITSTEGFIRP